MRKTLRQMLIDAIPEIGGRCFESHAAGADTEKPYLVIRHALNESANNWLGAESVEVYPVLSQTSFVGVDGLVEKILAAIDRKPIVTPEAAYLCVHIDSGEDIVDEEWGAITRRLKLAVYSYPNQTTPDARPDPIASLNAWTVTVIPAARPDPAAWDLTGDGAALYWRAANIALQQLANWGAWFDGTFAAHVICRTQEAMQRQARAIVDALARAGTVVLDDGSPLMIRQIAYDGAANPYLSGQIRLSGRYGVPKPKTPAQPMNQIHTTLRKG
jgi:hypothetical protein